VAGVFQQILKAFLVLNIGKSNNNRSTETQQSATDFDANALKKICRYHYDQQNYDKILGNFRQFDKSLLLFAC
jgi:hypothetical protein